MGESKFIVENIEVAGCWVEVISVSMLEMSSARAYCKCLNDELGECTEIVNNASCKSTRLKHICS